ncbi:hypothetical protein [Mycobacterium sp. D16R24]|uniref:hypothetical protein n=1 Tax=Mycobacterium sp. D16R24 TaxID=1855656 RepID=UPI0025712F9E|nr:hypothetical protein [Mycobacterium sp. D16R24]
MRTKQALRIQHTVGDLVGSIPNLLGTVVIEKFTLHERPVIFTPAEVAARIAAVLPDALRQRGYAIVELPRVEPDGFGGRCVRVPLVAQPWADGEIRIDMTAHTVAIVGIPSRLLIADVPVVATALLSAHYEHGKTSARQPDRKHR